MFFHTVLLTFTAGNSLCGGSKHGCKSSIRISDCRTNRTNVYFFVTANYFEVTGEYFILDVAYEVTVKPGQAFPSLTN